MKQIILLEDEQDRVDVMLHLIRPAYPQFTVKVFDRSREMIDYLKDHLASSVFISLDHDLPLYRDDEGELHDHGSGREVADYLANQNPVCPVAIHSTNIPAATSMQFVLNESGWSTFRLTPYGDLIWIEEYWWPIVKDAIAH